MDGGSTRPTTCGRGSARPSSRVSSSARSGRTGGGRETGDAAGLWREGRVRRARGSRPGSASIRSTRVPLVETSSAQPDAPSHRRAEQDTRRVTRCLGLVCAVVALGRLGRGPAPAELGRRGRGGAAAAALARSATRALPAGRRAAPDRAVRADRRGRVHPCSDARAADGERMDRSRARVRRCRRPTRRAAPRQARRRAGGCATRDAPSRQGSRRQRATRRSTPPRHRRRPSTALSTAGGLASPCSIGSGTARTCGAGASRRTTCAAVARGRLGGRQRDLDRAEPLLAGYSQHGGAASAALGGVCHGSRQHAPGRLRGAPLHANYFAPGRLPFDLRPEALRQGRRVAAAGLPGAGVEWTGRGAPLRPGAAWRTAGTARARDRNVAAVGALSGRWGTRTSSTCRRRSERTRSARRRTAPRFTRIGAIRSARCCAGAAAERRRGGRYTATRRAHSSSGLGHRPLTAAARARIPCMRAL